MWFVYVTIITEPNNCPLMKNIGYFSITEKYLRCNLKEIYLAVHCIYILLKYQMHKSYYNYVKILSLFKFTDYKISKTSTFCLWQRNF